MDESSAITPEVSIVIRTKNEAARIETCLSALMTQDTARTYEIIVIDSGSTDGTLDICRRFDLRLHTIPSKTFNYGRALNLGARLARGRYFVSFTAHAAPVNDDWLEQLLGHLDRDSKIVGVFSRELPWPDATPLEAARLYLRFPPQPQVYSLETVSHQGQDRLIPQIRYSNVASATRRALLLKFPFPEIAYGEDRAWARMLLRHGYRIVYEPAAQVYHSHSESLVAYYRRQYRIGRSKREITGSPPSLWSIVRVALGDLRGQARYFRRSLSPIQRAYWTVLGGAYCGARCIAQASGSRGKYFS